MPRHARQGLWLRKKSAALAGAPNPNPSNTPAAALQPAAAPTPAFPHYTPPRFDVDDTVPASELPDGLSDLFTQIGEKDTRKPQGEQLPLPGDLGKFMGPVIERHEYALCLRGDKGAGKTRLQYQMVNMLAGLGLNTAVFSLEIDKNSAVIARNTAQYIEPANRPRVSIASEAPKGLATIRAAAKVFDVVAIDSWGKIPGVQPGDFDALRKQFPLTLFIVIFQSTVDGKARGGSTSEYDASAVCQVNVPGIAVMEKNRYALGPADEFQYDVNARRLVGE